MTDDGGQVLMIGHMLGEDHEGHRYVGHEDGSHILEAQLTDALKRLGEGKLRQAEEGAQAYAAVVHQIGANQGEDGGQGIAGQDADDEGNQPQRFLAVSGAEHGNSQRNQAAEQSYVWRGSHSAGGVEHVALDHIADGVACQAQTDDGHGGPDDYGGHQLVNPFNTHLFDYQGDDYIHQAGEQRAQNQAQPAQAHADAAGKGCEHGVDECEGGAKENGAFELGEQQVDNGAHTGAKHGGGRRQTVADNHGDGDGGGQDG